MAYAGFCNCAYLCSGLCLLASVTLRPHGCLSGCVVDCFVATVSMLSRCSGASVVHSVNEVSNGAVVVQSPTVIMSFPDQHDDGNKERNADSQRHC